ncbi:hypothetical protein SNEBB_009494 [Seison nebaliae]|nr:hypothetical protein SNEBB_009494 [Seison nebaliae]
MNRSLEICARETDEENNIIFRSPIGYCEKKIGKYRDRLMRQTRFDTGTPKKVNVRQFQQNHRISSFYAKRLFDVLFEHVNYAVEEEAIKDALEQLENYSTEETIKLIFDFYDINHDGVIDTSELVTILKSCMKESLITLQDTQVVEMANILMEKASNNHLKVLTLEDLTELLNDQPELLRKLRFGPFKIRQDQLNDTNSNSNNDNDNDYKMSNRWWSKTRLFNRKEIILFWIIFILIHISLAAYVTTVRWDTNWWIIVARINGMLLNFDSALIILIMLRRCLTYIKGKKFSKYLPMDELHLVHQQLGRLIVVESIVHTFAHLGNILTNIILTKECLPSIGLGDKLNNSSTIFVGRWNMVNLCLFDISLGIGWIAGLAPVTGVVLCLILLIMSLASLPVVRKSGYFQVFHWIHQFYWFYIFFLVLHAPNCWKFLLIPTVLMVGEKLYHIYETSNQMIGSTLIQKAYILPNKVTHLVLRRPRDFKFKAGDYIFIKIPGIASNEWHPFTISSAPELKHEIWLHIRTCGNWTNRLYEFCNSQSLDDSHNDSNNSLEFSGRNQRLFSPRYGSPMMIGRNATMRYVQPMNIDDVCDSIPKILVTKPDDSNDNEKMDLDSDKKLKKLQFSSSSFSPYREDLCTTIKEAEEKNYKTSSYTITKTTYLRYCRPKLAIQISGPYHTPTHGIMEAEHAVLIAAGIGVTPFASILQSIMFHMMNQRKRCPSCQYEWKEDPCRAKVRCRKVDFIWINRSQKEFEWFVSLLADLEIQQTDELSRGEDPFLTIHLFMTRALRKENINAIGLQMALELIHRKHGIDLLTGLKTRTIPGRPNWNEVFRGIQHRKRGKVTVFYCGNNTLASELRVNCRKFNFKFYKEEF